jgi:hypothetical protein
LEKQLDIEIEQIREAVGILREVEQGALEELRKCRRSVYLSSLPALAIALTGAIPKRVPSLDLEFAEPAQGYVKLLLGLVVGYFLFSFLVLLVRHRVAWNKWMAARKVARDLPHKKLEWMDQLERLRNDPFNPDHRSLNTRRSDSKLAQIGLQADTKSSPGAKSGRAWLPLMSVGLDVFYDFLLPPIVALAALSALALR